MRSCKSYFSLFCLGSTLFASAAAAVADDGSQHRPALVPEQVLVTDFRGKPPFKRRLVAVSDLEPQGRLTGLASIEPTYRRVGPPGKNRAAYGAHRATHEQEIARFARFEEDASSAAYATEEASTGRKNPRRTRGAPGKSNPALGN